MLSGHVVQQDGSGKGAEQFMLLLKHRGTKQDEHKWAGRARASRGRTPGPCRRLQVWEPQSLTRGSGPVSLSLTVTNALRETGFLSFKLLDKLHRLPFQVSRGRGEMAATTHDLLRAGVTEIQCFFQK